MDVLGGWLDYLLRVIHPPDIDEPAEGPDIHTIRLEFQYCGLLNLPVDVILEIMDHLPLHTLSTLLNTSRTLRTIIRHHYPNHWVDMLGDRMEIHHYLHCMSRLRLDVVYCPWCVRLQRVRYHDYPRHREGDVVHADCYPYRNYSSNRGRVTLAYRHIQLALKYTRLKHVLSPLEQIYLQRLVAPTYQLLYPLQPPFFRIRSGKEVLLWLTPRLIHGRFLILREYGWHGSGCVNPIHLTFCVHQKRMTHSWLRANPVWRYFLWGTPNREACFSLQGACPFCPTDVLVEVFQETYLVSIWQDYGGESAVPGAGWMALTTMGFWARGGFGCVRRLYESAVVEVPRLM